MYRKYKVTSDNHRNQTTTGGGKAADHSEGGGGGKNSHPTHHHHQTHQTIPASAAEDNANRQKTSSSLATSSTVAKQHGNASSSIEDAVTIATVDAAWRLIDEQSVEEMRRRRETASASAAEAAAETRVRATQGWKTIRVFVSSTFADMHSEREILVKKVFPELREWCEERKFVLVDCDLRWGVPKDSPSRTTICTCLEEIDRCHEDNERLPFFVSILSDRYGWIPSESEVPEDIRDKYDWVPQTSITHMEILHGAFRFQNPNAIFCLRNSSYVDDLPSDKVSRFVDQEKLNQLQLKVLKQRLNSRFRNQVFEYVCRVDGIDVSTGREKVNIVGLESFAEKILDFLKAAIYRQYPDQHLATELSPAQTEHNAHNASMQVKSEFFVGRTTELKMMLAYINGGERDPQSLRTYTERRRKTTEEEDTKKVEEEEEEEQKRKRKEEDEEEIRRKEEKLKEECQSFGVRIEDGRILCVVGQPGIGKSSLLAKLAKTTTEEGLRVLYHSVGTTDASTTANGIIRRILHSLTTDGQSQQHQQQEKKNKEQEEEGGGGEGEEGGGGEGGGEGEGGDEQEDDLLQHLKNAVSNAASRDDQLVIIIDGLDELIDNDTSQFLSWLPPRFPGRLHCVVSCSVDHYPCMARLESRDSLFLDLEELTRDGAACMVEYYLKRFNKRLDSVQLTDLLRHRSSSIPLWLSIACEELRVFGDFATVSSKIKNFPDELNELMKDVFQRLIREDETQAMQKVLSWIHCSKSGLPEKAILSLLGNLETNEPAPLVTWATVRRHVKPFIRSTGDGQSVRISMNHSSMKKAVEELLFGVEGKKGNDGNTNDVIQCHSYLADYYQYHCSFLWMTLAEIPHHLYHAGLGQRMIEFYRKDERTAAVTGFERSRILNMLRCHWFADNSRDDSNKFYACHMCSISGRLLSPNPMPSRDMCAICGNWSPWKQPTSVARVCMKHKMLTAPTTSKCFICGNVIFLGSSMSTPLHLCNYCHVTGSSIMKCAHLEK